MKKFLWALLLISQLAEAKQLDINPKQSRVLFEIEYMKLTNVQGQFREYKGTFTLNDKETEISNINVDIKAASIDTNDGKRDFHLKGHEFFLVKKYPDIFFKAKGPVSIAAGKALKVPGTLTLKGVNRPVALEGIYKGKIKDPEGNETYFFELKTEINRQDFGMNWNKTMDTGGLMVGDKVDIKINLQAQQLI